MSFSSVVKNELCRIEIEESCCLLSELSAIISMSGIIRITDTQEISIKIVTENAAFARRVFSIIKKVYSVYPEIMIKKCKNFKKHMSYAISFIMPPNANKWINENDLKGIKKSCCKKSYLRGAFFAGGSMSDPEKTYHLEITCHQKEMAETLQNKMIKFGLHAKVIVRKGNYVTYIKEGEDIVDFLNIIGAHGSLLEMENLRILKDVRNNVNRIVNCETANLEKTINASVRQIENIRLIKEKIGFENLPKGLREIAEIRLENNDANLVELGKMVSPPLGKSGVNHRLRKLDRIAFSLSKDHHHNK